MADFERTQVATLVERLAEPPRHLITLFGPRQTGKTTIVHQALGRIDQPSRYRAVDEPDPAPQALVQGTASLATSVEPRPKDGAWLVREWEAARHEAAGSSRGAVLVLDEVQAIPQWSGIVKGLWDADRAAGRRLHVVILGSSPLRVQAGLNESLAGRFEPIRVAHWSFAEMAEAFGLELPEYLYFGAYPGAASLISDAARWRNYILRAVVEPNVDRDVLAMTRVDKPALLKRLFELGAGLSGQIVSYTSMLGPLQDAGNTTTLARYLQLLEDAGLLAGLSRYATSLPRRGSSPKLNVLNTALMTVGTGYTFDEARVDRTFWGRVVESAVGAHLHNTATSDIRLYYWRHGHDEVDFVLHRGPRLVAVEVKSGRPRRFPRGLDVFSRRFSRTRVLLVGEAGVPLNEFLAAPAGHWLDEA